MFFTDTTIENIINELSKIDSATEKVIQTGNEEKEDYNTYIAEQTRKFDKDIETSSNLELSKYEDSLRTEARKKLDTFTNDIDKEKSRIQSAYDTHKDEWASEIFNRLINTGKGDNI